MVGLVPWEEVSAPTARRLCQCALPAQLVLAHEVT